MEINDLMNLITNVGFPIAVCAYLLFRLEKQLIELSSSINKLNTIISTKLGVVIDTSSNLNDENLKIIK
ncbi:YvrJ family protein [uncultured Clostridium sp.]|uniref:YvrJ family protein n=1 Tax=uncultured Clostridium sp. TaxID=59620 RepID=UPI0028EA494C|nr:YvrJ family protein [uncultured Clostridium sp.]